MSASELAKKLFEGLGAVKDAAMPALKNAASDIGAEVDRLKTQGSMELASALFNGHAFVPYGPGQYTPSQEHSQEQGVSQEQTQDHAQENDQELAQGRGGMGR